MTWSFIPLAGCDEIGLNMNVYGYQGSYLMVDCGITFRDARAPGADLIMPDPSFIVERKDKLVGLAVTHAHEDHIGAIPYIWPLLRCPIFCTPFTAAFLKRKLRDEGIEEDVPILTVPLNGTAVAGPFAMEWLALPHSIPETSGIAFSTNQGVMLHAGEWKFDPTSPHSSPASEARLQVLGDSGVRAMFSDSTNVFEPSEAGTEAAVRAGLEEVLLAATGRVVVTCFASNITRLESVVSAAVAAGRQVGLLGRSMHRMVETARACGYFKTSSRLLEEEQAAKLPKNKVVWLATGSQGEPRAALANLANDRFKNVRLEEGDTVIFSSRVIPGNELAIYELYNLFTRMGVHVITADDAPVHVSGHPGREELKRLYRMVRPQLLVPFHGEARHLEAHATLAQEAGIPRQMVLENGDLLAVTQTDEEIKGSVPHGRWTLDHGRVMPLRDTIYSERLRLAEAGSLIVTLLIDGQQKLRYAPRLQAPGFTAPDDPWLQTLADSIAAAFSSLSIVERRDDTIVADMVRQTARAASLHYFKRPFVTTSIIRV